jgi:DNA ligase-1
VAKAKRRKMKVMLARTYKPALVKDWTGMYADPKSDGIRVIIVVDGKARVTCYSRNGRVLHMFSHIDGEARKVALTAATAGDETFEEGAVMDGEMVSKTGNFGDISGAIHRKNYVAKDARYVCFHIMPLAALARGKDTVKQLRRNKMVGRIVESRSLRYILHRPPIKVDSHADVKQVHAQYRRRINGRPRYEGTMVKDMHRRWEGKRSNAWLKIKDEKSVDVVVVGMKEGAGKYAGTLGALIVDYKGKKVPVSGMTDDQRNLFWKKPKLILKKMVEVEYQEETVHGSLRHPRYKRHRPDKEK